MPPSVALIIYLSFSLWLLRSDLKRRGYSSVDFWLPFIWLLLSGERPMEHLKILFSRVGFVLVPLSLCLVKYFPNYGRYYNPWTWSYNYGGVANDKNMLGMTLAVCGFFIAVGFLQLWKD